MFGCMCVWMSIAVSVFGNVGVYVSVLVSFQRECVLTGR